MKVAAALAWYEEPLEFLDRLVRSLAGRVDCLVAVDGRWGLFPGGEALSPRAQAEMIRDTAEEVGLAARIHRVCAWESQVAKRDYLMRLAGVHGDWILVVDGDEHVSRFDTETVRRDLNRTERLVASALTVPLNTAWPYDAIPSNPRPVRKLFRSGVRVETAHNGYRLGEAWLNGDVDHVRLAPALDLSASVHVAHDNANRGKPRNLQARAYRKARRESRAEAWA